MSDLHQLKGPILQIGEMQTIGAKGFTKREFIVQTESDGKYPQKIKLELVKEACSKLDAFSVGQEVIVSFNIKGSEYNGKNYVSLQAWKIEEADAF